MTAFKDWRAGVTARPVQKAPAPCPGGRRAFPPRPYSRSAECLAALLWFAVFLVLIVAASLIVELTMDVLFEKVP